MRQRNKWLVVLLITGLLMQNTTAIAAPLSQGENGGKTTVSMMKKATSNNADDPQLEDPETDRNQVLAYDTVKILNLRSESAFHHAVKLAFELKGDNNYVISRSEDSGATWKELKAGIDPEVEYVDRTAEGGKTYRYKVTAGSDRGKVSKEIEVTVKKGGVSFKIGRSIFVGESYKIPVTYTGYDQMPQGTWSVENKGIASISQDGVVTGIAGGNTKLTLTLEDGNSATGVVYVNTQPEVENLQVDVAYEKHVQLSWEPCDRHDVTYVYRREGSGQWQRIAEVSRKSRSYIDTEAAAGHTYEYKVTGLFETGFGVKLETSGVTVTAAVLKNSIQLTTDLVQTKPGEVLQLPLKAEGFETAPVFTYTSDNEQVASVDAQGKVTVHRDGKAVITIKSDSGWEDTCTYFSVVRPSGEYTGNEWRVFTLTNQNRMKEGHKPLLMFGQMQKATDIRKKELVEFYSSSHARPDGSSCFTVFEDVGLEISPVGENIAKNYPTADRVVEGWMNSEGHYLNMMDENFVHFATGEYQKHWVQMFGGCDGNHSCIAVLPAKADRVFKKGTAIEDFGEIVVVNCSEYGNAYMPLISQMCSGYDPNKQGEQTITVSYDDLETTFTVTIVKGSSGGSGGSGGGGGSSSGGGGGSSSGGGGGSSSGGGGGSSSGGGGGSLGGPGGPGSAAVGAPNSSSLPNYVVKGTWNEIEKGKWTFTDAQGVGYKNTWAAVYNPYANAAQGQQAFDWFRFDENGIMMTGWFLDPADGCRYYMNPVSDNTRGRMVTGWHIIDGKYYYFNPNSDGHRGRMLANEKTDDGYYVDGQGVWIQ